MKPLQGIRILVAEDERPVRMLVRVVLETAGATVIDTEDGVQALRALELHADVDVICTDLNMPNLDGFELLAAARIRRPDLASIICSARDPATLDDAIGGVDAWVQKPFVPTELVRAVDGAVHARALRCANAS